jgi:DNA-binding NtrC family response regulator
LSQGRNEDGAGAASSSAAPASTMSDPSVLRISVGMSLEDVERTLITATLQAVGGSKTEAARLLGISLKTMYNRLHAYGDGCIRRKPVPSSNGYDAWAA